MKKLFYKINYVWYVHPIVWVLTAIGSGAGVMITLMWLAS